MSELVSVRIEVPEEMKAAIDAYANKSRRPMSDIVRHAIARYVEQETGDVLEWRLNWGLKRLAKNGHD